LHTNVVIPDELLANARTGDERALADLWDVCSPLLRLALQRHGQLNRADVDDLAQEAAVHFLAHVHTSNGDGAAFAESLGRVLYWRVHNFLRRERRRKSREAGANLADLEQSLAKKSAGAEMAGPPGVKLRQALLHLSPRQRAVVNGLYFRDRPVAEIARELAVSPQAITAVHRRALIVLRKSLTEGDDGE